MVDHNEAIRSLKLKRLRLRDGDVCVINVSVSVIDSDTVKVLTDVWVDALKEAEAPFVPLVFLTDEVDIGKMTPDDFAAIGYVKKEVVDED